MTGDEYINRKKMIEEGEKRNLEGNKDEKDQRPKTADIFLSVYLCDYHVFQKF